MLDRDTEIGYNENSYRQEKTWKGNAYEPLGEIEKELESPRLYRTAKNVGEYIDEQINTQLHADQQGGRSALPSGGQGSNAANAGNRRVYEAKYGEPAGGPVPPPRLLMRRPCMMSRPGRRSARGKKSRRRGCVRRGRNPPRHFIRLE